MCLSHIHFLLEVEPIRDLEIPRGTLKTLDSPLVTEIKIPVIPTTYKLTQCQIQTPTTGELEVEINIAQQASKYFLCIYFLLPKGSNEIVEYFYRTTEQKTKNIKDDLQVSWDQLFFVGKQHFVLLRTHITTTLLLRNLYKPSSAAAQAWKVISFPPQWAFLM